MLFRPASILTDRGLPAQMPSADLMIGPFFLVVGLAICGYWLSLRSQVKATGRWRTARGLLTEVEPTLQGVPRVSYTYTAEGARFTGHRIRIGGTISASACDKFDDYDEGVEVDIFYDPQNPSNAVLERNLPYKLAAMPIVGACFALAGVLAVAL